MNLGEESEFQEHKESLSQLDKGIKSMTAMLINTIQQPFISALTMQAKSLAYN